MIYRKFKGKDISVLGMGMMRLPVKDGNIDEEQTERMIDTAISCGINYFDTAWPYHDGMSEVMVGKYLSKYPRDTYYLADKFPGYDLSNMGKASEIFEEQLKKCNTDHFDFYLVHNVCELNIDHYLDPKYGDVKYLIEQRKNGRISNLGFSLHGSVDVLRRFLDAYGEHMEFAQLQLNYVDWDFQDSKAKYQLLTELGIPIAVMEPVRGGMLANVPEDVAKDLKDIRDTVPVGVAYAFLLSLDNVYTVLSGASSLEQMKENIELFGEGPLTGEQVEAVLKIGRRMVSGDTVPCTGCNYCKDKCPKGLDISRLLSLYNEHHFTKGGFIAPMAISGMPEEKRPSGCIGCRKCEQVCPQQIRISEVLKEFTELLK